MQGVLAVTGVTLTLLTLVNRMPPALLLTFSFVLGAGSAFSVPAFQAMTVAVRVASTSQLTQSKETI